MRAKVGQYFRKVFFRPYGVHRTTDSYFYDQFDAYYSMYGAVLPVCFEREGVHIAAFRL